MPRRRASVAKARRILLTLCVTLAALGAPARAGSLNGVAGSMPAYYDGTLFTINTLLIVAFEVQLNRATAQWPNVWALFSGCVLFAVGFGALGFVVSASGILITVVIWTFGEMMLFPAMAAHLGEIAPENRRGAYMGAYSMSLSIALTVGPWLGTQLLATAGPAGVWSVMFALGALAAVLMVFAAPQRRPIRVAIAAES